MGLYGNVIVEPANADYWPPVHREVVLTLDDVPCELPRLRPGPAPSRARARDADSEWHCRHQRKNPDRQDGAAVAAD
jgi:hypothetical protein